MQTSILISIKKMLDIVEVDNHFDTDIIMHINSTMMTLNQLGVGPESGFLITGVAEKWNDFLLDPLDYAAAKSYIYLKVRLIFDPPSNSFTVDAMERQIKEIEWRLNVNAEKAAAIALEEGV